MGTEARPSTKPVRTALAGAAIAGVLAATVTAVGGMGATAEGLMLTVFCTLLGGAAAYLIAGREAVGTPHVRRTGSRLRDLWQGVLAGGVTGLLIVLVGPGLGLPPVYVVAAAPLLAFGIVHIYGRLERRSP